MINYFNDEELRALVMPMAVALVNTETQRIMGNCNTKSISEVVAELCNIVKFGVPQEAPKQEVLPPVNSQTESMSA